MAPKEKKLTAIERLDAEEKAKKEEFIKKENEKAAARAKNKADKPKEGSLTPPPTPEKKTSPRKSPSPAGVSKRDPSPANERFVTPQASPTRSISPGYSGSKEFSAKKEVGKATTENPNPGSRPNLPPLPPSPPKGGHKPEGSSPHKAVQSPEEKKKRREDKLAAEKEVCVLSCQPTTAHTYTAPHENLMEPLSISTHFSFPVRNDFTHK